MIIIQEVFKIAYIIQSKFLRSCKVDIFIYIRIFVSWKKKDILAGDGYPYRLELPLISLSIHPKTFVHFPKFI